MAGHSHWAQIKRKKSVVDAKRGKIFTKLIREISVAAKLGGPEPDHNSRLRLAISDARAGNMSNDTIDRAIKKATGGLEGLNYEEHTYEGYGPGGTAILVDCLTDNKQRTVPEVRHAFGKHGGNMGESGCVSWNFESKGLMLVPKGATSEEELFSLTLDRGAEDIKELADDFEIITDPKVLDQVRAVLDENKIQVSNATLTKLPKTTVKVDGEDAEKLLKLLDALEDLDDVQKVYSNADIPEETISRLS